MTAPELTVLIPALNEAKALPELLDEIEVACAGTGRTWEALVIDDGSTDGTMSLLASLAETRPWLKAIRLRRNFGKSAALGIGFGSTDAELVVTIDGDGQDDPADIPKLLDALSDADVVSGWKRDRQDPFSRRLASRFFNRITASVSKVDLHDMNCGLKAYRGECARSLEIYGEMHRFIPVLAAQQGWRVTEVPVNHRPRVHGRSRFGLERYLRGAMDLLTVSFLGRYQYRPLHLFGGIGLASTLVGLVISLYLLIVKLGGDPIGQRPLLFLGILLIVVGVQFLTLGLLGQLIVNADRGRGRERRRIVARTVGLERPGEP